MAENAKYNAWLPEDIRSHIPTESESWKSKLLDGLERAVAETDFKAAASSCKLLHRYLELDYPLTVQEKVKVISGLYQLLTHKDVTNNFQARYAQAISSLIKSNEQLPLTIGWRPLYEIIDTKYFLNTRTIQRTPPKLHSTAIVNLVKSVRRYFTPNATQEILEKLRPMFCPHDSVRSKAQGFLLFIPTTAQAGYDWIDECMAMWNWIEYSDQWKYVFMDLFARASKRGIGIIDWRPYFPLIFTQILSSFELPIGSNKQQRSQIPEHSVLFDTQHAKQNTVQKAADLIVWALSPQRSEAIELLSKLIRSIQIFCHPSNGGHWTNILSTFLNRLCYAFTKRLTKEQSADCTVPIEHRIDQPIVKRFIGLVFPVAQVAIYSKSYQMHSCAVQMLKHLAYIDPKAVFPRLMDMFSHALQTLTETHQTTAAIHALYALVFPMLKNTDEFPMGKAYLADLLALTLPGIDANDMRKTEITLIFYSSILCAVPISSKSGLQLSAAAQNAIAAADSKRRRFVIPEGASTDDTEMQDADVDALETGGYAAMMEVDPAEAPVVVQYFEEWALELIDRIFICISHQLSATTVSNASGGGGGGGGRSTSGGSGAGKRSEHTMASLARVCDLFFHQMSNDIYQLCLKRVMNKLREEYYPNGIHHIGSICSAMVSAQPETALAAVVPFIYDKLIGKSSASSNIKLNSLTDTEVHYYLCILAKALSRAGDAVLKYKSKLLQILSLTWESEEKETVKGACRLLKYLLRCLTTYYQTDMRSIEPALWNQTEGHHSLWGRHVSIDNLHTQWHSPSDDEISFAIELINTLARGPVTLLRDIYGQSSESTTTTTLSKSAIIGHLDRIRYILSSASVLLPTIERRPTDVVAADETAEETTEQSDALISVALGRSIAPNERFEYTRADYADLLHTIATSLLTKAKDQQAVDEPLILIALCKAMRPLVCLGGSSKRDSYKLAKSQLFASFQEQKHYPRAFFNRRVTTRLTERFVQYTSRLAYNDQYATILNDLVDLSLASYSLVRKKAQSVLTSCLKCFPPFVTRKLLPRVLTKLSNKESTIEELNGAIFLLQISFLQRRIFEDWKLTSLFWTSICQTSWIEKESVQSSLRNLFNTAYTECRELPINWPSSKREANIKIYHELVSKLVAIGSQSPTLHWRYQKMVLLCLKGAIRSDKQIMFPLEAIKFIVKLCLSDVFTVRSQALSAFSMVLTQYKPLQARKQIQFDSLSAESVAEQSQLMQQAPNSESEWRQTHFYDKNYLFWNRKPRDWVVYDYSNDEPMDSNDATVTNARTEFINAIKPIVTENEFLTSLFTKMIVQKGIDATTSNAPYTFTNSEAQLMKGMAQLFGIDFLTACTPLLERMASFAGSSKPDEERGNVAILSIVVAGILRGSKHWSFQNIQTAYQVLLPIVKQAASVCSTDAIGDLSHALQFATYDRDHRRLKPIAEFIVENIDLDSGSTVQQLKSLSLGYTALTEFSWRGAALLETIIHKVSPHIAHPFTKVRTRIGSLIANLFRSLWEPPRDPITKLPILKDATTAPQPQLLSLINNVIGYILTAKQQQQQQQSGSGSDISSSDTSAKEDDRLKAISHTVLHFLSRLFNGLDSIVAIPYIPFFLPVVSLVHDSADEELQKTAKQAFVSISQAQFNSVAAVDSVLSTLQSIIIQSTTTSTASTSASVPEAAIPLVTTSWRVRGAVLLFLQTFTFRNQFFLLSSQQMLYESLFTLLQDKTVEVREFAAMTLAGFINIADESVLHETIKRASKLASTKANQQQAAAALTKRHAGVLGLSAVVLAFPYDVPKWMPAILVQLSRHANDTSPINQSVRKTFTDFWRTHSDTWHLHKAKFTEDELFDLTQLLVSPSYYA